MQPMKIIKRVVKLLALVFMCMYTGNIIMHVFGTGFLAFLAATPFGFMIYSSVLVLDDILNTDHDSIKVIEDD